MTFTGHRVPEMIPCSEEERELIWMREKRTRLLMHVELVACRDEFDWLIRCYIYAANSYTEEYCPPMPLPIPSDYIKNLENKSEMTAKCILPPTLEIIMKTHYPLPGKPPISPPSDTTIPVITAGC